MSEFSTRLKSKMNEKRVNQSTLARRLGVTPTAVWNWENGNSTPRQRSLKKLADVLGVDPDWLLGGGSTVAAEEQEIDSIGDEVDRLRDRVAELNGVEVSMVKVKIEILSN